MAVEQHSSPSKASKRKLTDALDEEREPQRRRVEEVKEVELPPQQCESDISQDSESTTPSSTTLSSPISPATTLDGVEEAEIPTKKKVALTVDIPKAAPPPVSGLRIKRHSDKARIPTRGSALAAGYDLYSAEKKVVPARGRALINTQISIGLPEGTYGRVAPRSGLAWKFMIDTGAGVIDADYRGLVNVLLFNLSDEDFEVDEGDRVAQLIIERIYTPEVVEVEDLEETVRGAGGFGSTGGHCALEASVTV